MKFFQKIPIIVVIMYILVGVAVSLYAQGYTQGQTSQTSVPSATQSAIPSSGGSSQLPVEPLPEALLKLEEAPVTLIGMTLQELLVSFGVPASVAAVRGIEAWQDDIVFNYNNGFSFYIYKNRVWKIKISAGYSKPFMGIQLGSTSDIAITLFGLPKIQDSQYAEWSIPFENWPMRLRILYDANNKVTTLFLYRSDI